jgi:hypothetical protein
VTKDPATFFGNDYRRRRLEPKETVWRCQGLTPTLRDYFSICRQRLAVSGKRASAVQKETAYLARWTESVGTIEQGSPASPQQGPN